MFGGQGKFDEVVQLVERWRPAKEYSHERKFQDELQNYLDEELNRSSDMAAFEDQTDDVVSKEHGKSKGDVVVNDSIGIELKRELSNSQTKKLRGQIEDYLDSYNYVIVCACGIRDMDGWRDLKNKYEGASGFGLDSQEIVFIHKKNENYGGNSDERSGGLFGGDSLI